MDVNSGQTDLSESNMETYLGDILTNDGKNIKNILARKAKGYGIIDRIINILDGVCFGPFQYEVALMLRNSLFLNGILSNSEAWYGLTIPEVTHLEQIDEILIRKILEAPSTTPKCMLYLETGCKPIRFTIQTRRLMFLQYILKEDSKSLISMFFHAQNSQPHKNDWALTCKKDLEELKLELTFDEIKSLSKQRFMTKVSKAVTKLALSYLITEKQKLTKVLHISYSVLKMEKYFLPNATSIKMVKFIFHARSRMLDLKSNYKNKVHADNHCPVCKDPSSVDSQQHLLECASLADDLMIQQSETGPAYDDLFSTDVKKIISVAKVLADRFQKRKNILNTK